MENYEQWVTIEEAAEKTGISKRTLQRKLEKGEIRKAHRNIPGRKPLPILHPEDIEALTQQTLKPVPILKDLAPRQTTPRHNDIASLAQWLAQSALHPSLVTLDKKSYLSLKEAAMLSGLPRSYWRKQVKAGTVSAIKLAGWRLVREEVEQHRVTA